MIFKLSLNSVEKNIGQRSSLPNVIFLTLGKEALCTVLKNTRQRNSLPSVKNKTLGKELLRQVFSFTEGLLLGTRQRTLCRVPEKHSTKHLALGKEPNSSSAWHCSTIWHLGEITIVLSNLYI
jgi:hypothetical protein